MSYAWRSLFLVRSGRGGAGRYSIEEDGVDRRTHRLSLTALGSACAAIIVSGVTGVASGLPATSSPTEAGYTATVSGSTFVLKTQLTVPTLTCSTTQAGIQAGAYLENATSTTGGAIDLACSGRSAAFQAVATINNTPTVLTKLTIAAGDAISITVSVSATATTVVVVDTTKTTRESLSGTGSAPTHLLVGDTAVAASGGGNLAVPSFVKIRFKGTLLITVDLGASSPTAVNMVNAASVVQITAGKLSTAGTAFSTIFDHS
jgi:hypothetical protein